MGLCVCSWMGGQGGDLISGIFEAALECPEDLSLSTLKRRPHKYLSPRKPARPEVKDEESKSVRDETLNRSVQSREAWNQDTEQ